MNLFTRFFTWLCNLWYRRKGWTFDMTIPPDLKKAIVIVAPHTSTEDFFLGNAARYHFPYRARFLGKQELFSGWKGVLFRWAGGIPVDRANNHEMVRQISEQMARYDRNYLVLAPEGTRQRTERWRTGFYHIAMGAGLPIVLAYIDFRVKKVGYGPILHPTGDRARDFAFITAFYNTITPKHPDKYHVHLE
jgi:1-acyl-sn-glycerol-3-phosphate acyltransferase